MDEQLPNDIKDFLSARFGPLTLFREMAVEHLAKRLVNSSKTKKYHDIKPRRKVVTFKAFNLKNHDYIRIS